MRIHEQAKYYKSKAEWLEADMRHLLSYVNSPKFYDDKMVNSSDIIMRIQESLNDMNRQFHE